MAGMERSAPQSCLKIIWFMIEVKPDYLKMALM
jgi:hypothetical protein